MSRVMIRGIYATALTKLLTDEGFLISQPSIVTAERFGVKRVHERNVVIVDREDRQGVRVEGETQPTEVLITTLAQALPDMIIREQISPNGLIKGGNGKYALHLGFLSFDLEFPYGSKVFLDRVRRQITSAINNHHLLKIVDPEAVDTYETLLGSELGRSEEISDEAKRKVVYDKLTLGRALKIQHVKPEGSVLGLTEGRIRRSEGGTLLLHRRILGEGQKYDGLEVLKTKDDYAVTLAVEGSSVIRHSYYSSDGVLKGEFCNINTPVEFYPDRIRYVDLEIDVIRRPNEPPEIVDSDKLNEAVESGFVSSSLAQAARDTAQDLIIELSGVGTKS